ncbi:hypothetical protein SDC9_198231 [bioreactor metagenome]|uniref:Uncharacterized protein n=1 Tax=bioreactor metagenome TaxID=1076179 RepID=A0A645IHK8_9ZZZZ
MPVTCSRFSTNHSAITVAQTAWVPNVIENEARKPAIYIQIKLLSVELGVAKV